MTNVMIRQPGYMPNLGFFKKIQSCDIFVFLDDVQFVKDRFDNRNRIKSSDGITWIKTGAPNKNWKSIALSDSKIVGVIAGGNLWSGPIP